MALIGSITIGMKTELKKLEKGIASARSMVSGFGSKILSIGAPLTAAFSTVALEEFARHSLETAHTTEIMARRIGTTAAKLQTLRYAAKMTGTDTEALETGLQKMSVKLGEARIKGGPAADTIARLGLSVTKLTDADPADAFISIAGAISKLKNPMEQAAAAQELFGKGGIQILNTLRAQPEELARLATEAQRFGLALNATDTAKVTEASHALARMGSATEGLGNVLIVKLAPSITNIANLMTDWIVQFVQGEGIIGAWSEYVAEAFGFVSSTFDSFVKYFEPELLLIGDTIETVFRTASIVIRNFGDVWTIVKLKAFESFANVFAIANTLPENFGRLFGWLSRNWLNLLRDMVATFGFFTQNLLINATNFGKALIDALRGKGFTFEFKPLLEGLTLATEALPELVKPAWVSMQKEIDAVGKKIADKEVKRAADIAARVNKPLVSPLKTLEAAGQGETTKFGGLAELGSKEAYTAILKYQGGGKGEDAMKDVAKTVKAQLDVQREQLAETRKKPAGGEIFSFGST